jgi:IS5 family transposase
MSEYHDVINLQPLVAEISWVKHLLIDTYEVTSAEVHDSQPTEALLRAKDKGQKFFGDSAYGGEPLEKVYEKFEVEPQICERACRNRPLQRNK